MATEKIKSYADLIVSFTRCPFEKVEADCPFVDYWNKDFDEVLTVIDQTAEKDLLSLRGHHQKCLQQKLDRGEELKFL